MRLSLPQTGALGSVGTWRSRDEDQRRTVTVCYVVVWSPPFTMEIDQNTHYPNKFVYQVTENFGIVR